MSSGSMAAAVRATATSQPVLRATMPQARSIVSEQEACKPRALMRWSAKSMLPASSAAVLWLASASAASCPQMLFTNLQRGCERAAR